MTLPDERYRSIVQTREFLMALADPRITERVPKAIRNRARSLLKHYPSDYILEVISEYIPEYFVAEIEPVTRMFMKYENTKNERT